MPSANKDTSRPISIGGKKHFSFWEALLSLRAFCQIFRKKGNILRIQVELGSSCKLELVRFSILLKIQDRAKVFSVQGTELNWGGDTAQTKCIPGGRDTYFLNRVPIGGGTPHIKTGSQ